MFRRFQRRSVAVAVSVVSHRFEDTTDRCLIFARNTAVLLNQVVFHLRQDVTTCRSPLSSEHKFYINALLFQRFHIAQIQRVRTQLVIFLRTSADTQKQPKLSLSKP